jgi:hypothetical protein
LTGRVLRAALPAALLAGALAGLASGAARAADAGVPAPSAGRPAAPAPCPLRLAGRLGRLIQGPGVDVAWRTVPQPVVVGQPFAVEFEVCPRADGGAPERLTVDAWMPDHRHGMNYRPTLSGAPPEVLRADGLLFHMPGRWQLVFEMRSAGRALRLTDDLTVR